MPTPVGPIMRMFFGSTSSRSSPVELLAAPAVAQGDGDGALGVVLADDMAVSSETISGGRRSLVMGPSRMEESVGSGKERHSARNQLATPNHGGDRRRAATPTEVGPTAIILERDADECGAAAPIPVPTASAVPIGIVRRSG